MAIGVVELTLLAVIFLVIPIGVVGGVIYAIMVATKEWIATYEEHNIVLQNQFFSGKLYIDGEVVDHSGGFAFSATLRGKIEREDGSTAVVEGRVLQGKLGLSVRGHVLVDEVLIGGDPLEGHPTPA